MTSPAQMENRAEAWPIRVSLPRAGLLTEPETGRAYETQVQPSTAELAFRIVAAFRAHPHINNVLTHISRTNWALVERDINSIIDPATVSEELSPLAQNLIDLMCAERGVTGKILKPYFHDALGRLLEPSRVQRLIGHIEVLFIETEWKAEHLESTSDRPFKEPPMTEPACERVIDVTDIDPQYRHMILVRLFEHLTPDRSLQLVVDHDPRPLHLQLEAQHGSRCDWSYLEQGPDVWRVRLRLLQPDSAGGKEPSC